MKKLDLVTIIEVAIFAAFAMVLDLIPSFNPHPSISISFAMLPIFILAFRRGFLPSCIAGLLWGLLQIFLGDAYILVPTQAFIEYFIAFTCIGFAGLFANRIKTNLQNKNIKSAIAWIVTATFVGSVVRYFWHFVAGVIFWGQAAIDEGKSAVLFSLTMNGITFIGAFVTCAIILVLLIGKAPHLITSAKTNRTERVA